MISIFKVHQVGLRGDKIDVVVKHLMMTDICNLQAFALCIQKNDIKLICFPEREKQVSVFTLIFLAKHIYPSFMYFSDHIGYEFDFLREANAMERICYFLYENNIKNYEFLNNVK
ncbi:hypothetical protein CXB51_000812 [Gossypium anomalum]|uniref:Uncharacterized protein n=1 Tax=Gossypium anomalum TaxID=47600 RepID=A0A8J5ZKH4_9ROSI|nr:hypothetical protein CXB51_000812 [Gossypium anomalum]